MEAEKMDHISFKKLEVGEITNSSGIFSGENILNNWKHRAKINEGFGNISGDQNQLVYSKNILSHPDNFNYQNTKKE